MTRHGTINLLGMLLLPVAATVAGLIVFGPGRPALVSIFALNLVPMLIGGLVTALLLRGARRAGKGLSIALWPTLVPAVLGAVWYLFRAVVPDPVAPGAEYIAAPQYLLMGVILTGILAWVGCRIARSR